jgi:hypothetical protein
MGVSQTKKGVCNIWSSCRMMGKNQEQTDLISIPSPPPGATPDLCDALGINSPSVAHGGIWTTHQSGIHKLQHLSKEASVQDPIASQCLIALMDLLIPSPSWQEWVR